MIFNFFKSKKISNLRKNLGNPKWVVREYEQWLTTYEKLKHFDSFECSDFFRGKELANHNRVILKHRTDKYYRRLNFFKNILKEIDTPYYEKYIGKLTPDEKLRLNRNDIIDDIIK